MAGKPGQDNDAADGLGRLNASGSDPWPAVGPTPPVSAKRAGPTQQPHKCSSSFSSGQATPPVQSQPVPAYRCLRCGYPLGGGQAPRCAECGSQYDQQVLDCWFSGEEKTRFEHVIWLVSAGLFLRLLILPELRWVSRVGTALVAGWACYLARQGRSAGVGGYYATAGMAVALLMFFFSWSASPLPFYTLDMIAACLLLLAMLHDPDGVGVGGPTVGRRAAPIILFATPVLAVVCAILDRTAGSAVWPGWPAGGGLLGPLSLFTLVIPYVAAGLAWLLVWRSLARIRAMLFR